MSVDEIESPWLTDPKYGGMSEAAARASWAAGQRKSQLESDVGRSRFDEVVFQDDVPPVLGPEDFGLQPSNTPVVESPPEIAATPFVLRDPTKIPTRQLLYGRHLIRGYVSGFAGVGGGGKSALGTVETLANVTGRPLLGCHMQRPLRCWVVNLEDPRDEIERRLHGACLHYGISAEAIGDRLFVDSGRDQSLVVARTLAGGATIIVPMIEAIIAEVNARQIDILRIDPFVSSHEVSENDNGAIDMVIKRAWGAVAERGNCAVELVHHLRKLGDNDPSVDAARGAGAFVAGCRAVRILAGMKKDEASRAGVENHHRYFRVFSGKANMAPQEDNSDWFHLASVDLGNGGDGPSDNVQVVKTWEWPNAFDGIHVRDLFAVQKRISESSWRASQAATQWAGKAVAEVLDLDLSDAPVQSRVKSLIKKWIETGALKTVTKQDEHRKEREFIEVGQWATP